VYHLESIDDRVPDREPGESVSAAVHQPARYRCAVGRRGATEALFDGEVGPGSIALDMVDAPRLPPIFREMVRSESFDICEMALATYLQARERGCGFTALPVFPQRGLHHGAIKVHRDARIVDPSQLEGRIIGVARGYGATTGVWARGILQDTHGIDPTRVTWLVEGDEHVPGVRLPPFAVRLAVGRSLTDMLASGEISAAIGVDASDPAITPLYANAFARGIERLDTQGYFPINHLIVVRDACIAANPALARTLFDLFVAAKQRWLEAIGIDGTPTDALTSHLLATGRDPLPYGLAANRAMLERFVRYVVAQQIIAAPVALETLFIPGTEDLAG